MKASGIWIAGLIVALAVSGCARREEILQGERFDTRTPLSETLDAESDAPPVEQTVAETDARNALELLRRTPETPEPVAISLPAARSLQEWTHRGGSAAHYVGNAQVSAAPRRVWSANIGAGNSRKYRISSDPVVAGGRVYTLDSQASVSAFSLDGGLIWRTDLTPASDRSGDATGGGLAYGNGTLYATTGFGRLVALDPATGAERWTQRFEAPVTGAPTVAGDLILVSGRDNAITAVRAANGRLAWTETGAQSASAMITGAAPAFASGTAVFPTGAAELVAARPEGVRIWGAALAGQRRGFAYAGVSDITGDPVIVNGTVYAGTQAGRFVKIDLATGERIWTATEGAYSPGVPVGGSVFIVSDQAQLVRLSDATGETIWAVDLPYFKKDKPKRLKSTTAHFGPVLAGGRLVVGSDDGRLRFFSPEDGRLLHETDLPGGAASLPALAGGALYILSGNGQVHAFR